MMESTMNRDGITKQIELLGQLSRTLDEYFGMKTIPAERGEMR